MQNNLIFIVLNYSELQKLSKLFVVQSGNSAVLSRFGSLILAKCGKYAIKKPELTGSFWVISLHLVTHQ